jgi:DNA-binding NtrC family response regulator
MSTEQIRNARRRLALRLRERSVKLETIKAARNLEAAVVRIAGEARAAAVVIIDDECPGHRQSPWLQKLAEQLRDLHDRRWPRLVCVTRKPQTAGMARSPGYPMIWHFVKWDEKHRWIDSAVRLALDLADQITQEDTGIAVLPPPQGPEIVGENEVFLRAIDRLEKAIGSPCGLVTGEVGAGKIFLIRALWGRRKQEGRMVVLPCGSFFKDYYVGGILRRFGGGRESIDQLRPYLVEADGGLLVLHHVERLPTALQEELAVRLETAAGNRDEPRLLSGIDSDRLDEQVVTVIGTSTFEPDILLKTGRVNPDLLRRLAKHHVRIPSLTQRGPQDIRLLAEDIVARISKRMGRPLPKMDAAVVRALAGTDWPNNISDLVRTLEHAVGRCRDGRIRLSDLPGGGTMHPPRSAGGTLDSIVEEAKRAAIIRTLEQTGGDVEKAARILGRHPKRLYPIMAQLGLTTPGMARRGHGVRRKRVP